MFSDQMAAPAIAFADWACAQNAPSSTKRVALAKLAPEGAPVDLLTKSDTKACHEVVTSAVYCPGPLLMRCDPQLAALYLQLYYRFDAEVTLDDRLLSELAGSTITLNRVSQMIHEWCATHLVLHDADSIWVLRA